MILIKFGGQKHAQQHQHCLSWGPLKLRWLWSNPNRTDYSRE